MNTANTKQIITELAEKYGISKDQVRDVIVGTFRAVKYYMGSAPDRDNLYFPTIRVKGLGSFACPDDMKYVLDKIVNKRRKEKERRLHEAQTIRLEGEAGNYSS